MIGNDYGFEQVFARQVQALGRLGDVVVAISTSGRSRNVVAGVDVARQLCLTTIGLTGGDGGLLAGRVDIPIVVPSSSTARIQECHITIGHILCEMVEDLLLADEAKGKVPEAQAASPEVARHPKVVEWEALLGLRAQWRAERKIVVWTNGCFDLLHVGHVRSLQAARPFGDVLVVGVNSDASARQLKGPGRPIVSAAQRAEVLAALGCVDIVTIFDDLTPEVALARLQPDIHCKGAEYAPPQGKPVPEADAVVSYGGRIEFLPMVPSNSTTDLVRRIREMSDGGTDATRSNMGTLNT